MVATSDPAPGTPGVAGDPVARALRAVTICLIGLGAVGRPLARELFALGARRFILCDPKRYRPQQAATGPEGQCRPDEVGELKVKVVARELCAAGATSAVALPCPVETVEPGRFPPDVVFIVAGDSLNATRAAHDAALSARSKLFVTNIEPLEDATSFSAFDYAPGTASTACAICGWGAREFRAQTSAVSCADGDPKARETGSPPHLSRFAGRQAAGRIAAALADTPSGREAWGRRTLLTPSTSAPGGVQAITSRIGARPGACPGGHGSRRGPYRIRVDGHATSLEGLADSSGIDPERARLSGSGDVALAACCARCGHEREGVWWHRVGRPAGRCPRCTGLLHAIPSRTHRTVGREELGPAWKRPIAALGISTRALIEIDDGERSVTYILAPARPDGCTASAGVVAPVATRIGTPATGRPSAEEWDAFRGRMRAQALECAKRSPVLDGVQCHDLPHALRVDGFFTVATLVEGATGPTLDGPVEFEVLFREDHLVRPPPSWALVTLRRPRGAMLPNLHVSGGLCLGDLPRFDVKTILETTYDAVTLRLYNDSVHDVLNVQAADYTRAHRDELPLTPTGLFEQVPTELRRPLNPPAVIHRATGHEPRRNRP